MQNYFEKDYITISYDEASGALILRWLVSPTSAEFREGMNALIPAIEYFKTGKIVYDLAQAGALHQDDQQWAAFDWHGRAVNAGQSHVAIILSSDIFTTMSAEDTLSRVKLPIAYFNSMESAIAWIKQF